MSFLSQDNLNWALIRNVNGQYFDFYSNGGLGQLPYAQSDDSKTTDQVVSRRMQIPSLQTKKKFSSHVRTNPYFQMDGNRILTTQEQLEQLNMRGITVLGEDNYGQFNSYITTPDPSATTFYADTSSESMGVIGWILLGIAGITLLANATSQPIIV